MSIKIRERNKLHDCKLYFITIKVKSRRCCGIVDVNVDVGLRAALLDDVVVGVVVIVVVDVAVGLL